MKGLVFNIQHFSIHDGPGIRTTVFLKGCNLECFWCHNPESIRTYPEIQLFPQKCIGCGRCIEVCPAGAHRVAGKNRDFLRDDCRRCGRCAEECYAEALVLVGEEKTVTEVIEQVEKDRPFYENSGGGVTLSGGEPLLQQEFAAVLLEKCKKRGLHTAVDTAGNIPWATFEVILSYVDLFLFDVKIIEPGLHREATGAGNEQILSNLEQLASQAEEIWIRVPVIPGLNADHEHQVEIADWLCELPAVDLVELMPFHRLGGGKYRSLGLADRTGDLEPPSDELMESLVAVYNERGLQAKSG